MVENNSVPSEAPLEPDAGAQGDGARSRAPEWMATSDSSIVRSFAAVVTVIEPEVRDDLAVRILAHLKAQTAVNAAPTGYQFALPNGGVLTVYDQVVGNRRRLSTHAPRGPEKSIAPIRAWAWPRKLADHGAWFSWEMSERKARKLRADLAYAVRVAFAARSEERRPGTILIDPYATPPAVERR